MMKDSKKDDEIGVLFCGAPVIGSVKFILLFARSNCRVIRNCETCVRNIAQWNIISNSVCIRKIFNVENRRVLGACLLLIGD